MLIRDAQDLFVKITTSVDEMLRRFAWTNDLGTAKYKASSFAANAVVRWPILTKLSTTMSGALRSIVLKLLLSCQSVPLGSWILLHSKNLSYRPYDFASSWCRDIVQGNKYMLDLVQINCEQAVVWRCKFRKIYPMHPHNDC